MEEKIQRSTKLYTFFWVREKEKKFFSASSFVLPPSARGKEVRGGGEGGEENRGFVRT